RNRAGRTGTKEGCAEGDCGACTVVLGELSPDARHIEYRAINSCIRFLSTLDGKELVTVESLQAPDGTLHPVQRALVDCHGSQCGFCTPGFVMSLFALYLQRAAPTREEVLTALSGNLCRCTGYRPIIDAGECMGNYPEPARWSGAAVTLTAAWSALLEDYPALAEQARRFASPPVCNSGTLCGNIANGSPIGDSMPALIALGAELELRHGARQRRIPLERLYLGYQRKDLAPGELIVGVLLPPPTAAQS